MKMSFVSLLILLILSFFIVLIKDEKDTCLDIGECKAGTIVNVNGKQITINKASCTLNNGQWVNNSYCKF